ncbi:putative 2-keto-3-deoxy-L-rhamnonate aldolase [Rosa chinensis]|uniref:Putative 2-keto-3-deoxy-L-rhamnonate aldolase n=1 Tax=Rosa chinensis TaxID=74649 RepID=A0A2P6P440_ROSCH|nr:2-keto-3-deoxy-L-rhamnonate aldolase [Rosa chinensis]PRQ16672.1 putative 2-keto-3-deoxy-L-rhamnonate aldolase [Rosa chinensis]
MATLTHAAAAAAIAITASSPLAKPISSSRTTTNPLSHLSFPFSPSKTLNLTAKTTSIKSSSSSDLSTTTVTTTSISSSPQTLKSRLHNGDTLYGLFLLSFSPTLAEIAGLSGYDFVVVDMEHGPGGISEALSCLRALAATQTPAILRLPESSPTWAKKALDLGPQGIMFPMIDSSKEAEKAVSYCRFPPAGVRGSAHTVVRASSYGIDEGYLSNYEDQLLIMCQVETEEGVKRAEEIAAVASVDCVQMGPLDLSASLGYLWDPGNKKVRNALKVAEKAVLGTDPLVGGAYLAGFAMPHDGPQDLRTRGYHMVSGSVDVGLFRSAAVEDVRRFQASLINGSDEERGDDADEKYWSE